MLHTTEMACKIITAFHDIRRLRSRAAIWLKNSASISASMRRRSSAQSLTDGLALP